LEGIVGWRKKKKEALRGPNDLEARELTEIPAAQPQFFSSKRRLRRSDNLREEDPQLDYKTNQMLLWREVIAHSPLWRTHSATLIGHCQNRYSGPTHPRVAVSLL
jgi:hypothetical protein